MEPMKVSGPVIIENNKVLLVREYKTKGGITPWFFPGGNVEDNESLESVCCREVKEELGIDIEILKELPTITMQGPDRPEQVELHHFLAKRIGEITPATDIAFWAWHDLNNLPENTAPNITQIIQEIITNDLLNK